jgi:hypothetical protein
MTSEEIVGKSIKQSLEALSNRIRTLMPTTICHIGETPIDDTRQIYASFLKTPQSDTLDLCVLLRPQGTQIVVSADLVKGGSGDVLSELGPVISPSQDMDAGGFEHHIAQYILAQEDALIQELRQEPPAL